MRMIPTYLLQSVSTYQLKIIFSFFKIIFNLHCLIYYQLIIFGFLSKEQILKQLVHEAKQ